MPYTRSEKFPVAFARKNWLQLLANGFVVCPPGLGEHLPFLLRGRPHDVAIELIGRHRRGVNLLILDDVIHGTVEAEFVKGANLCRRPAKAGPVDQVRSARLIEVYRLQFLQ